MSPVDRQFVPRRDDIKQRTRIVWALATGVIISGGTMLMAARATRDIISSRMPPMSNSLLATNIHRDTERTILSNMLVVDALRGDKPGTCALKNGYAHPNIKLDARYNTVLLTDENWARLRGAIGKRITEENRAKQ